MKKTLLISVLVTLPFIASLAWAADVYPADKAKKPATAMTEKDKQMHLGKMQENMQKMHEQMHKIMDAKDPQERERLTQEHTKMMQDSMHMMQGDCGMMRGDAKRGKLDGGMKGK